MKIHSLPTSGGHILNDVIQFTHKGFLFGVPIYMANLDSDAPIIIGRWFWCDWALEIMEALFGMFCFIMCWINPYFEPMYPLLITGELDNGNNHN